MKSFKQVWWPALTTLSLAMAVGSAQAQATESVESVRQTTLNLIEALVQNGVLTREKADALIKEAQAKAQAQKTEPAQAAASDAEAGKPVIRVPYIPESVRNQIRDQVKEEVVAQAQAERWGVPNAAGAWTNRIKIDGDFRFRYQADRQSKSNTPGATYLGAEVANDNGLSRAPDFAAYNSNLFATASTQDDRSRERVRLRLNVTGKVTDEVGVGVRLATGSATDRVSTNQTLGNSFNKYQLFVDRAFMRMEVADAVTIHAGRIPNPWFSTEMVWSENLNFDGLSASFHLPTPPIGFQPFATVGWFPLREQTPPTRGQRALMGAQIGAAWDAASRARFKFGLAYYSYKNLAGQEDTNYSLDTSSNVVPDLKYGEYEYPAGMRQKGNTVFETNPLFRQDIAPIWGLAYQFRPLVLTASAELTHFSPYSLLLSAEYVKNMAFDVNNFHQRAGAAYAGINPGGKDKGYQFKLAFGAPEVREEGDWQVSTTYRYIGSDAVLDAFTDSDLGLGGTNLQGYILGGSYGLYRNTTLGARYLSAKTIDTPLNASYSDAKYKVNTLQVDLNVRF